MPDRPDPTNGQIPIAPNEVRALVVARPEIRPRGVVAPDATLDAQTRQLLASGAPELRLTGTVSPDTQVISKDYPFNGQLVLGAEPLLIGERNYSVLQNLHYLDVGLRSVNGYSVIIGTAHGTYTRGRSGIQFVKLINRQPRSHLLVHAENAGLTASAVLRSDYAIPGAATWDVAPQWTDGAGAGLGRFSSAPSGNVAYCNEVDSTIWGSEEHRVAGFIVTQAAPGVYRDYTEAMQNTLQTSEAVALIHIDGGTAPYALVASTRPLKGFKFYIQTPNTNAITASVEYWGPAGWTAVAGFVDGTLLAGESLGQTGSMTFTSTESTARVKYENESVFYWYRIIWSGASSAGTEIYHVTVDTPWQGVKDVWDGVPREIAMAQVFNAEYTDITLAVFEKDSTPAVLGALDFTGGDVLLAGFTERQMALSVVIAVPNVIAAVLTVDYWNGTAWVAVDNMGDRTIVSGASFRQNGVVSWTPPAQSIEFSQTLFGVQAYYYRLHWGATITATTAVDRLQGVPAPRIMRGFRFPFRFQNRLLLMGDIIGGEGHAAEFSVTDAPDIWNGKQSSALGQRLYFGDNAQTSLTAAAEIYNRFAGSLAYLGVVCSDTNTWLLSGSDPTTFNILPVSSTIGCPAPLTMTSVEVAYSVAEDAQRNVALWLSEHGPVIFDGSVIQPIPGLEPFFDPNDPRYINPQAISASRAWYIHEDRTWHVTFPTGTAQTTDDVEMAYDLQKKRWYEVVPANYLQGAVSVQDTAGHQYVYGLLDTGHVVRMENGVTWEGVAMACVLETADILPAETFWQQTTMRRHLLVATRSLGSAVTIGAQDITDRETVTLTGLAVVGGTTPYKRLTQGVNARGWTHRLRYTFAPVDVPIDLLAWAGRWIPTHEEM